MIVHLRVNLCVAPYFRWRMAWIEVWVVCVLHTLREEDLADKQLA